MQSSIGMPARTAVIAALVAALIAPLGLAGCGHKGGLDPPPSAAAPQQNADGSPQHDGVGPDGKPIAGTTPVRKDLPWLDWLLN